MFSLEKLGVRIKRNKGILFVKKAAPKGLRGGVGGGLTDPYNSQNGTFYFFISTKIPFSLFLSLSH